MCNHCDCFSGKNTMNDIEIIPCHQECFFLFHLWVKLIITEGRFGDINPEWKYIRSKTAKTYTSSYTYTVLEQKYVIVSDIYNILYPTQNRVPQGVGVRFPPRAPAFAREAERRLPAVALAKAGGASRRELRLASQPYNFRRSREDP